MHDLNHHLVVNGAYLASLGALDFTETQKVDHLLQVNRIQSLSDLVEERIEPWEGLDDSNLGNAGHSRVVPLKETVGQLHKSLAELRLVADTGESQGGHLLVQLGVELGDHLANR